MTRSRTFAASGDTLIAELQRKGATPRQFAGVIALGNGRGLEFRAVPGAVPAGKPLGGLGWKAVIWAVLGAIAGGILLNLMPCVFPILALKACTSRVREGTRARLAPTRSPTRRAQSSEPRRSAQSCSRSAPREPRRVGRSSCRTRERSCSCCFSQSRSPPTFSACSSCRCSAARARPAGSFGTGALAAFVATPCAGPFLGAALGTALLLPLAGSVLVFAALGLGLALPFVLVAYIPALRKRLPKPGAMDAAPSALPRHPDGGKCARRPVAALPAGRSDRDGVGIAGHDCSDRFVVRVGRRQRAGTRTISALFAALALTALAIVVVPRVSHIVRSHFDSRTVERLSSGELRPAGTSRVRLLHRRLVP